MKGVLISHISDCDNVLKGFGANSVQYERNFHLLKFKECDFVHIDSVGC